MESNDSEISECLNFLRPPVRRDYKTSRVGYYNNYNQQHSINFMTEWRKPKKRTQSSKRLRRELEASTSLILKKKTSSEQVPEYTGAVVSYSCLPNEHYHTSTTNKGPINCNPKQPKNKVDKPVIQVIVIPNEEGRTDSQNRKLTEIITNNPKGQHSIETKNVYIVVVGNHKDKVYEIKTTDTAAFAKEVKEEDVSHVFHGINCFKQLMKSLTMEKKKHASCKQEEVIMSSTGHICQCSSVCGKPNTGCCMDDQMSHCSKPSPCKPSPCIPSPCIPSPCIPPPCIPPPSVPPPCIPPPSIPPPCIPPPSIPSPCKPKSPCTGSCQQQELPPLSVGVGRNKVTIHGQIGINDEDRFIMKCAATVDDKTVVPEFCHIGMKAPTNGNMEDECEPKEKPRIIQRKNCVDKVTQCSCKCSGNEVSDDFCCKDKAEYTESQNPMVVISVFPKDQENLCDTIRKQNIRATIIKSDPNGDVRSQFNYRFKDGENGRFYSTIVDSDIDNGDGTVPRAHHTSKRCTVDSFTQDGEDKLLTHQVEEPWPKPNAYNDDQTTRPGRSRQATYNRDAQNKVPLGRPRPNNTNEFRERPRSGSKDFTNKEAKLNQDPNNLGMGLSNFNRKQIMVSHSSAVTTRNTSSNYTQDNRVNNKCPENKNTRNSSTQDDLIQGKKHGQNKPRSANISFSPDRRDQTWMPIEKNPPCNNNNCNKECLDHVVLDNVSKKRDTKNKNINCKLNRRPDRSPSPLSKNQRNPESHVVETSLVKTKRSQSPIRPNISDNKEPKKTPPSQQKTKSTATTSRSVPKPKRPKSKSRDQNTARQMKAKTTVADNYKKIVTERVDQYNKLSPKHDISKISVNIDSENECYDVLFHQDLYKTDLTVRKTLKDERKPYQKSGSLQNLFCKPNTLCVVKNTSDFPSVDENLLPESNSRFHVRDSLEISHRHNHKTEIETQTKKSVGNHYSVSNEDLMNFAPIKHFTGDDCTICDPIVRDKEIRELLGIPKRKTSSQKNKTQTQHLFGDKKFITQPFFDDKTRKAMTVSYSMCSCCCTKRICSKPRKSAKPCRKPKKMKPLCKCFSPEKNDKKKKNKKVAPGTVGRTNLYQQLILNRNIQVFLQVEKFCKQKPICLSKKQYDKVKKTIQSTLSKNKQQLQSAEKKIEVRVKPSIIDVRAPEPLTEPKDSQRCNKIPKVESPICVNEDPISRILSSSQEDDSSHNNPILEKKPCLPPLTENKPSPVPKTKNYCGEKKHTPTENKSCRSIAKKMTILKEKKTQIEKNSCEKNRYCEPFKSLDLGSCFGSLTEVHEKEVAKESNVGCECFDVPLNCFDNEPVTGECKTPYKKKNKKSKETNENIVTKKNHLSRCPCIQSLISIGEVRLKTRLQKQHTHKNVNQTPNKRDDEYDPEECPTLLEYQELDLLEEPNDYPFVCDENDDDIYLNTCKHTAPCDRSWLEYKGFKKLNKGDQHVDTVILYKRDVKNHEIKPFANMATRETMSSMEVRYANIAYIKQVTFSSMDDVFDSLLSDSSLALKDPVSIETLFKGHTKSPTPNLGTSTLSCLSEPSCPETPQLYQEKPAKRPFLRRLMSCLVMRSDRAPETNLPPRKLKTMTADSSFDSYHFSTSLGAIDMTSSLYDTSASFYSNHSVLPQNTKISKRGFLSSVRGFLHNRWS